ncbi:hypothetical protein E0485_08710 [Paenibacillus albiflavus]|uniref:Fibronectin type-III domain-containing protein n=1 Tax=Paenibacillus albiflavus TaxID=2545760 RepID=A0A4R4EF69_9BACL|nr:lamin tail domain-containing protein [Paenibacillus albiflavus]TCZ78197.1 hypothetical protein E0485_08710 [Paenibacillus albiflavus]
MKSYRKRIISTISMFMAMLMSIGFISAPVAQAAETANPTAGSGITQEALDLSGRKPLNLDFLKKATEGPITPGLKQDYTAQGLSYIPENNWIVNSYYLDGKPSIISITDVATGKFVKAMPLYIDDFTPYTGHAGGIAVSKQHVWISSGSKVYQIKLEDVTNARDGDKLVFSDIIPTEAKGSYVNYDAGVLWVGEFARLNDDNYKTDPSHHKKDRNGYDQLAWITGYKLNADDTIDPMATPDYILSTQDEIQGMTVIQDKVVLARSYGRNNMSDILIYQNPLSETPHEFVQVKGKSVPLWFLDKQNIGQRMTLPPMLEDAFELNGKVYFLFESGATQYRGDGLYPVDCYYLLNTAQLLDGFTVPYPEPVAEDPELLITEIANYDDAKIYEYVEIYNPTDQTIDLDGYLLWYYTNSMISHANEWPIKNKKIGPYQTLVLWLKTTGDPNLPLSEFNKRYGVDLTEDQVFQVMLTTSGQGLHKTAKRKLAIAKPGSYKGGPAIVSAEYNDELDGKGNVIVDNVNGTTNYYRYPESGNQMVKFMSRQKPNPGTLVPGQVPDPDLHLNLQAAAGDSKVTLSWKPSAIDLYGYRVYQNGQPVSDSVATVTSSNYSFTVENLMNGVDYEFTVTGVLKDQNGKPTRESLPSNTVRVTPMGSTDITDIQSIRNMIEQYVMDGQLKGPLVSQLTNKLDQAEHQFTKGSTKQAIKFLQDFQKHLDNKSMQNNVTENAKENLMTNVQALIALWSK